MYRTPEPKYSIAFILLQSTSRLTSNPYRHFTDYCAFDQTSWKTTVSVFLASQLWEFYFLEGTKTWWASQNVVAREKLSIDLVCVCFFFLPSLWSRVQNIYIYLFISISLLQRRRRNSWGDFSQLALCQDQ